MEIEFVYESSVELVDFMGGDHAVVNSARVSFAEEHTTGPLLTAAQEGLVSFLMKRRHGTPFESSAFTFRIETPIFVAREWFRHRIGSFNEMSGRYKELPPRFFTHRQARTQKGKPGHYVFEESQYLTPTLRGCTYKAYHQAWESYQEMLTNGIAKEQARCVLPVGIMTQFYWTVNARSLMNFFSLRLDKHAMQEIREAAVQVWGGFALKMPITAAAFTDNDFTAP